jgi:hypothetical protein
MCEEIPESTGIQRMYYRNIEPGPRNGKTDVLFQLQVKSLLRCYTFCYTTDYKSVTELVSILEGSYHGA